MTLSFDERVEISETETAKNTCKQFQFLVNGLEKKYYEGIMKDLDIDIKKVEKLTENLIYFYEEFIRIAQEKMSND